MTVDNYSSVSKILRYQLLLIVAVSLLLTMITNHNDGFSSLLGGIVAFIPNCYLALRMRKAQGLQARKIVNSFYFSEAIKFLLTIILFTLVLQMPQITLFALLIGYVTALSVFWFALLLR